MKKSYNKFILNSIIFITLIGATISPLLSQNRFPKPEFESGYVTPQTTTPTPHTSFWEYFDVVVLLVALSLSSYWSLKKRSRRAIFWLGIFSLLYFGFWREGCICPVGSVQNVLYALINPAYTIPLTAIIFFVLPLLFTLFLGRSYCAAVCPLGAIQDLVMLRPRKVPEWAESALGIIPYIYLGATTLYVMTDTAFIICRLDPFVGFFRLNASFEMILFGVGFLVLGVFIARPYCRFLCPYSVLLNWMSRFSKWHVTITPDECIQCRLCEEACPFGAIRKPTPERVPEGLKLRKKRLVTFLALTPLIILIMGWSVSRLYVPLSRLNSTVLLAERIQLEDSGAATGTTIESETFRSSGTPTAELFSEASAIRNQFIQGGWWLGGFIGLIISLKLIGLSIIRTRKDYEPDSATCLSCARCFEFCPKEHTRQKNLAEKRI